MFHNPLWFVLQSSAIFVSLLVIYFVVTHNRLRLVSYRATLATDFALCFQYRNYPQSAINRVGERGWRKSGSRMCSSRRCKVSNTFTIKDRWICFDLYFACFVVCICLNVLCLFFSVVNWQPILHAGAGSSSQLVAVYASQGFRFFFLLVGRLLPPWMSIVLRVISSKNTYFKHENDSGASSRVYTGWKWFARWVLFGICTQKSSLEENQPKVK